MKHEPEKGGESTAAGSEQENGGKGTKNEPEQGGERTAGSAVVIQKERSWGLSFRKDVGQWGLVKSGETRTRKGWREHGGGEGTRERREVKKKRSRTGGKREKQRGKEKQKKK